MLNKNDLSQIKTIVIDAIHTQTPKIVDEAIQKQAPAIISKAIQEQTPQIVEKIISKHLKPIKRDIRKIRTDLEIAVGALDKDRWTLEQKFDSHLSKFHSN